MTDDATKKNEKRWDVRLIRVDYSHVTVSVHAASENAAEEKALAAADDQDFEPVSNTEYEVDYAEMAK